MASPFDEYRDVELTLEELAAASARLSRKLMLQPEDRRVGSINERTIRFFQGKGLLDPPRRTGRQGSYTLIHLLQVLNLRRLQVQEYSLDAIKEMVDGGLPWQSVHTLERAIEMHARAAKVSSGRAPVKSARSVQQHLPNLALQEPLTDAARPPPHEELEELKEELFHRVERRTEEIAGKHFAQGLESLMPRLEAMLGDLLEQRLSQERTSREVQPGVRVVIDRTRVGDPDEILRRIEKAISDDR